MTSFALIAGGAFTLAAMLGSAFAAARDVTLAERRRRQAARK